MRRNGHCAYYLLSFAVAFSTIVSASVASAATTFVIGKAAPNADTIIPVNVGDKLGFFKKHGLDLKIVNFNGGSKTVTALTAGSLEQSHQNRSCRDPRIHRRLA